MNIVMSAVLFDDVQSVLTNCYLSPSFCFRMILDDNDSNKENVCTTEVYYTQNNIVKFQEQTEFPIVP